MSVLDKFSLTDRVVIVTGASSGLGVAFAKAAAEAGADVVLAARRVDKLEDTAKLVRDAGREALCVATDIVDPAQAQNMVDAAMEKFGRVDVLVNNAGVGTAVPATRETPDQFRAVIDIKESRDKLAKRSLAASGRSDDRHSLPRSYIEVQVLDDLNSFSLIGE